MKIKIASKKNSKTSHVHNMAWGETFKFENGNDVYMRVSDDFTGPGTCCRRLWG